MPLKIVRSRNFYKTLDNKAITKDISKRLYTAGQAHLFLANRIAPVDSGKLRTNSKTIVIRNTVQNVWLVPYANIRYYKNYKNPSSTEWAEKAYLDNRTKLLAILQGS